MSTILKALRRLEDDRAVNEQRPLRETVTAGVANQPTRSSGGKAGWIVALIVLLAAGGGAGYLAFRSAVEPDPPQLAAAPAAEEGAVDRAAVRPASIRPPVTEAPIVPPGEPYEPQDAGARELSDAALASRVERLDRPERGPRIEDTRPPAAEPESDGRLVAAQGAPVTTRLVRGQPLVPPSQLPGRQPQPERSDIVTRVEQPAPRPTSEPPKSEGETRAPRTASAPSTTSEPVVARRAAGPTPAPPPRQVVTQEPEPTARAQEPPPVVAAADPRPSRAKVTRVAAEPEPVVASTPKPVAKPSPTPSAKPAPKPAAKPASETSVPRAAVPDVVVAGTSWHPTANRRTATVRVAQGEPVEVHEGDAVGTLVVARIEPSSVVFTHDGVEIRRRIGQR